MKVRCLQTGWTGDVFLLVEGGEARVEPVSLDVGAIDLAQCVVVEATYPERFMLEQCGLATIVAASADDEWTVV